MPDILHGPLSAIALCWRIERRDGAGLALTSHDQPLIIGGVAYDAAPGMLPAAIQRKAGLDPSGAEVAGAMTSASLDEQDLALGRWDGARVTLIAVDWEKPGEDAITLARGELGEVRFSSGEFTSELRGAAARLQAPICPETSPECRAELGDKRCRIDLAGRSMLARILSADGSQLSLDREVGGDFLWGRARFLSGGNCGLSAVIVRVDGTRIDLREPVRAPVEAGAQVELRHGCDKSFSTCSGRFANGANFRGEPHLPGNDLLTRYPGA